MEAMFDVFINRVESNGLFIVTNNAGDVPAGARFVRLCMKQALAAASNLSPLELCSTEIDLIVTEISVFRKPATVLPRGWSGALQFEGKGIELLRNAIEQKAKQEYLHLEG